MFKITIEGSTFDELIANLNVAAGISVETAAPTKPARVKPKAAAPEPEPETEAPMTAEDRAVMAELNAPVELCPTPPRRSSMLALAS